MKATKFAPLLFFTSLLSILSLAVSAQPFVISADGSEVTDQKTGLIWKRCSEGMAWDGTTCAGTAGMFTHEAALALARTQASSTGVAWRLPNIKELASITDKSRINPATDASTFPATPVGAFWSSSPLARGGNAWVVGFDFGLVDFYARLNSYSVRLVRAGQ